MVIEIGYNKSMEQVIVIVAKYFIIIPVVVASGAILWRLYQYRDWKFLALVVIGGVMSLVLAKGAGLVISHPQPFVAGGFPPLIPHAPDNSFPSDHTLLAAFLAFAILKRYLKTGLSLVAVALLIGIARVFAGLHYPVDIIASFLFAGVGVFFTSWFVDWVFRKYKTSKEKREV